MSSPTPSFSTPAQAKSLAARLSGVPRRTGGYIAGGSLQMSNLDKEALNARGIQNAPMNQSDFSWPRFTSLAPESKTGETKCFCSKVLKSPALKILVIS